MDYLRVEPRIALIGNLLRAIDEYCGLTISASPHRRRPSIVRLLFAAQCQGLQAPRSRHWRYPAKHGGVPGNGGSPDPPPRTGNLAIFLMVRQVVTDAAVGRSPRHDAHQGIVIGPVEPRSPDSPAAPNPSCSDINRAHCTGHTTAFTHAPQGMHWLGSSATQTRVRLTEEEEESTRAPAGVRSPMRGHTSPRVEVPSGGGACAPVSRPCEIACFVLLPTVS
jgi:hypothetical protein